MIFEAASLDRQEVYQLLTGGITPRPIAWISTLSRTGVANIAPYSFFTVASCRPPILCYSQTTQVSGEDKDTLKNLIETKECVVHIVNGALLEKMNLSAAMLSREESEFTYANIPTCASHGVRPPSVEGVSIRYECALREIVRLSASPGGGTLVLLEVKYIVVDDTLLSGTKIDQSLREHIGRLSGDFYSTADTLIELPRP